MAIGDDVQASILTASLLLQLKVPVVWAKAVSEQHGTILEQLGVHHVIYPEKDMGRRVAHLVRGAAIDYLEIDKGYSLVKAAAPARFVGIPLGETRLRQAHGVTIAAFRDGDGRVAERRQRDRPRGRRRRADRRPDGEGRGVRAAALTRYRSRAANRSMSLLVPDTMIRSWLVTTVLASA